MAEAARRTAVGLAAVTVLAEIAYPLVHDQRRTDLTVLTVAVFFLASVTHAVGTRGLRWAVTLVAVTAGGGLFADAVGLASGFPFGGYGYADSLGPSAFGVPLVVPLAWTMMAYPAYIAAGRLVAGRVSRGLLTGYGLATWDVFLDPQMVDAGHWYWDHPQPGLPGVPGVPLTNYAGWLAVATMLGMALTTLPRGQDRAPDGVPLALYLWTYFSCVLAHAAFFDLPGSALWGALAMGLVAVPLAVTLLRSRS